MTPLNWIAVDVPGALAITPHPQGGDHLIDEVRGWRTAGLDLVVSALEPLEEAYLELSDEADTCERLGIEFFRFPILDRSIPPMDENTKRLIRGLAGGIEQGQRIAVHCRVGIGRSGLLCSSILVALGHDPAEAFLRVGTARGLSVPDTREQIDWVYRFAAALT
jgi:hypothetical protein